MATVSAYGKFQDSSTLESKSTGVCALEEHADAMVGGKKLGLAHD